MVNFKYRTAGLRIALYLQTEAEHNLNSFNRALSYVKAAGADLIVFPENCWTPFTEEIARVQMNESGGINKIISKCGYFAQRIKKPVLLNSVDGNGISFSIYVNPSPLKGETQIKLYVKHLEAETSALDFLDYEKSINNIFQTISLKGKLLGITLGADCHDPLYARMYGLQGIDVLLSCAKNEAHSCLDKYAQMRALENHCLSLVLATPSDEGKYEGYVYGCTNRGQSLAWHLLNQQEQKNGVPGGVYLFDCQSTEDSFPKYAASKQVVNAKQDLILKAGSSQSLLAQATQLKAGLYLYEKASKPVAIIQADDISLLQAEQYLPLVYAQELQQYKSLRYIILCRQEKNAISLAELKELLKLRALENHCAVILEGAAECCAYQVTPAHTVQELQNTEEGFALDFSRMTGPASIWKNKVSGDRIRCRASWRKSFQCLIQRAVALAQ